MKSLIFMFLLCAFSFQAMAQTITLPRVEMPSELAEGAFAEGTITRLNSAEVAEFLPWAQNSRNQLNRAMTQARALPLRERLPHIERAVRTVVARSDNRQYQMLMRFALNRGLLLVTELKNHVDMNLIGSQESALDLLQRSITVSLSFYESDLTFQQRAQEGDSAVVISHAVFGTAFMQEMYPGVVNVMDATAQYRLLYKLIEMVNWDLSRDAEAPRFAEAIVEAFEMAQDLPAQPAGDDRSNLRLIRRLNSLKIINLRHTATAARAQNTNEADGAGSISAPSSTLGPLSGNQVYWIDANNKVFIAEKVTRQENGNYTLRLNGTLYTNVTPERIARTEGCVAHACVSTGQKYWRLAENNGAEVYIVGIYESNKLVLKYTDHPTNANLAGLYGPGWDSSDIVRSTGSQNGIAVNTVVYNIERKMEVRVVGFHEGKFAIQFLSGTLQGKVGGGWDRDSLALRTGCISGGLCVGDRVINIPRALEAEVYAIQADGKYTIRFTSGNLSGQIGEGWERSDLTKL